MSNFQKERIYGRFNKNEFSLKKLQLIVNTHVIHGRYMSIFHVFFSPFSNPIHIIITRTRKTDYIT